MILPNFILPSRVNQHWQYSGIDDPVHCFNKEHFASYPHKVEYHYNSRGFRDQEWPENLSNLQNSIWCIGDSFTVGVGSPITHTWPYLLQQKIKSKVINISLDGGSNNWIARRCTNIIEHIKPKIIIIHWSYLSRREHPGNFLDHSWASFYQALKDPQWPDCPSLKDFNTLPLYIQNEILTNQYQGWKCGLTDEQLRMPYVKSTTDEDIDNTIDCIKLVNNAGGTETKIIHSFVPDFIDPDYKKKFNKQLSTISNNLIIPEFKKIDLARDGHHYDIKTADYFTDEILKILN